VIPELQFGRYQLVEGALRLQLEGDGSGISEYEVWHVGMTSSLPKSCVLSSVYVSNITKYFEGVEF
jgi:hypothetical protein